MKANLTCLMVLGLAMFGVSCDSGTSTQDDVNANANSQADASEGVKDRNFGEDVAFLNKHIKTVVLGDAPGGARVVVVPAWQGRVMTSAAKGEAGTSYGWINDKQVSAGKFSPQISVFGGEERFWIGPEGSKFSYYFDKGEEFDFANWAVPAFVDTEPWKVTQSSANAVKLEHDVTLANWAGSSFSMNVVRDVKLVASSEVQGQVGVDLQGVDVVAYETDNTMKNTGENAWTEQTGKPSIWILGMFKHGPKTTVVIPYIKGDASDLGPAVNDAYFGKIPAERLKVDEDKAVMYFLCDGKMRSKIGVTPQRSKGVAGSWDAAREVLTIVYYNQPKNERRYVNSMWDVKADPFSGDAINGYNDGVNDSGGILGPFYEIETSSPALGLKPGESYTHTSRTIHLEGDRAKLDAIAVKVFGVNLKTIEGSLK